MTVRRNLLTDAVIAKQQNWNFIEWDRVCYEVRKLQFRIAKAVRESKWRKVKALQWLLTHSYSAKCLAVRKVTQNRGKNTPGVDDVLLNKEEQKMAMVYNLKRRDYKPKPLRRVYIPKSNGKKRPLGIPTMKDRAMQALHSLALEPVAETTADWHSYGFRPERCTADAIAQLFIVLAKQKSPVWILEGDIKGCFDNIRHRWMLDNVCTDTHTLEKWLKAGYIDKGNLFPTDAGTPQGGIISPLLSNMTLDGIEDLLGKQYGSFKTDGHHRRSVKNSINFVRYADDFIVTAHSRETLEKEIKPLINKFLEERGLELSVEKTVITHITNGFDFLGQNVRKYPAPRGRSKLLIKPSKKNVTTFLQGVRETIKNARSIKQGALIQQLNPKIRGWANYHRGVVSKAIFSKVDYVIWHALRKWAKYRHPKKNSKWIERKYFQKIDFRNGWFGTSSKSSKTKSRILLFLASDVLIQRHIKIKRNANPYDPAFEGYFEERISWKWKTSKSGKQKVQALWKLQNRCCPICAERITSDTGWRIHYLTSKMEGGSDTLSNLCLLHPKCHEWSMDRGFVYILPVGINNANFKSA